MATPLGCLRRLAISCHANRSTRSVGLCGCLRNHASLRTHPSPRSTKEDEQYYRRKQKRRATFHPLVRREGGLERLGDFWTPDCVKHAAPDGQQQGLEAPHAYYEQFAAAFAAFSDANIDIQQQVAEADRVVTQMLTTARHSGIFFGMPATGKTVSLATIRIDRLRDGKIAEHWSVADMAGFYSN